MATLFELTGIFKDIYEMDLDDETKVDTLESIDWTTDFENKVDGYVKVIKSIESEEAALADEITRMQQRKTSLANKKTQLKRNLQDAMTLTGQEKVKTLLFSVTVANNAPSVVVDEEKLPKKYFIKKLTPDKKTIKDLLKEGKKIKGAELQQTRSLRIR